MNSSRLLVRPIDYRMQNCCRNNSENERREKIWQKPQQQQQEETKKKHFERKETGKNIKKSGIINEDRKINDELSKRSIEPSTRIAIVRYQFYVSFA